MTKIDVKQISDLQLAVMKAIGNMCTFGDFYLDGRLPPPVFGSNVAA
jgi:hypothetical protein